MDKRWKYSKATIFVWYKNGTQRLLGVQSINTESFSELWETETMYADLKKLKISDLLTYNSFRYASLSQLLQVTSLHDVPTCIS